LSAVKEPVEQPHVDGAGHEEVPLDMKADEK
jgi:hypothetical protein